MTQLRGRRLPVPRARAVPPFTLESFAALLYDAVGPVAVWDELSGWALAHYCAALGVMFQSVQDVARDTPEGPGWSAVVDLERCPDAWLPWLAQFVGVTVATGWTPAQMRARIAGTDGFKRGSPDALEAALGATLTGSRVVMFRERNGSAYRLEVVTKTAETPDPALSLRALLEQKPAGIVLAFRQVTAWDYEEMTLRGGKYSAQSAQYATYLDLSVDQKKV